MMNAGVFKNHRLPGGFVIASVTLTREPIVDALGRAAIAQTIVTGHEFRLLIRRDLGEAELSVTLYHEILEAVTVACDHPPASVLEFNEGDFEQAAKTAHARWGPASPHNLNRRLQFHGFQGE